MDPAQSAPIPSWLTIVGAYSGGQGRGRWAVISPYYPLDLGKTPFFRVAILWKKEHQGVHYQVRSAGYSRRLYSAGVLHSQYNLRHPVTGAVWDALFLPGYFLAPGSLRRVLVLGVGGGTVIRQLQHFFPAAAITGVELNPMHLQVARRFFGVDPRTVKLVEADAKEWLRDYSGPPFDMVIDDLFSEQDGEPVRAVRASAKWFGTLLRQLNRAGVVVMNFASSLELKCSAYCASSRTARRFDNAYRFTLPRHENVVAAFIRGDGERRRLRAAIKEVRELDPRRKSCRLNYSLSRLSPPAV